ncbi:hypothetical protein EP47_06245 [Legionella norrlandica]|uniref:Terpenoid synthase n=1 Tax=Legionella norrlandica TaxID=1498499 RepID=A0A0A2SRZ6_9GAMM|nr:hypothetical protein [Legionella norrlandica]KGP62501.1 hypothetical protein EP47_06245 [Legionella norrlandica]
MTRNNKLVETTIENYFALGFERNKNLFTEFLPNGYTKTTLNNVIPQFYEGLISIKILLGIFITLYDDFADNPKYHNLQLLSELMKIPEQVGEINTHHLSDLDVAILSFAKKTFTNIHSFLQTLPHVEILTPLLLFDLNQFYNGLKYSVLVRNMPSIANSMECACYLPHNMGIILVGMMDLMACAHLILDEIGTIREFFWYAQRFGNICNTLTTLDRELSEQDFGNEIVLLAKKSFSSFEQGNKHTMIKNQLIAERVKIINQLRLFKIHTFSTSQYIEGLLYLQNLHQLMEGVI